MKKRCVECLHDEELNVGDKIEIVSVESCVEFEEQFKRKMEHED